MSTLAVDSPRVFETGHDELINELPVIASDIIYEGAAVGELNDAGTHRPLASADKFAGFCTEQVDNSAGAAGDRKVKVKQFGRVVLSVTGVTAITDLGKDVFATDDDTFTITNSGSLIGKIVRWITGTTCVVEFKAFVLRQPITVEYDSETVDLATDRAFFVAPRAYYILSLTQVHSVAAGGTSELQVVKDTATDAPGAGVDLLSAAFDLNGTANTVQYGAIVSTAGYRKLAKGDRLSIDYGHAIQSTAGNKITVELIPL